MEKFNCILPTWDDIAIIAKKTTDKIKADKFRPDIIIAIARGGMVPARIFCDHLHIKSCYSIKVDHWGLTATKDGEAKLTYPLTADLAGKKVLIVDDITDTGKSMELAVNHILDQKPSEVKTATIFHLNGSRYRPDYYGEEREWSWIIFPWNHKEDMVNIIKKIGLEKTPEEIHSKLKEFNIKKELDEVTEILDHIQHLNL